MNCTTHQTVEMLPTGEECDCCGQVSLECPWCEEVAKLKREIETQKLINTGPALHVPEGAIAYVEGPIGALYCTGGTVHLKESSEFPNIKGECSLVFNTPPAAAQTDR